MKRAVLALAGTAAGLVGVLSYRTPPPPVAGAQTVALPAGTGPAPAAVNRTLTGRSAPTRWGPVQVAVVLSDGRITSVQVLEAPASNRRDQEINTVALPILQQQTLQLQSADVDVVSGATYTSEGYRTSLQSALGQR